MPLFDDLESLAVRLSSFPDADIAEIVLELYRLRDEGRDLKTLLDTTFDRSPMPLIYSRSMTARRVNSAFCELVGYPEAEILGRSIPLTMLQPDEDLPLFPTFRESSRVLETLFSEALLKKKNGQIISAMVMVVPFKLPSGEIAHISFVQETSERKELERLMVHDSLVVSRSPLVIFEGTWEGASFYLSYVSENVSLFGYSPERMVGGRLDVTSIIHPEDLPLLFERVARDNGLKKYDRQYHFRLRNGEGQYRWISFIDRVFPGETAASNSVVGILMDVTERKQAEIALEKSHEKMREQVELLERAWEQTIRLLAGVTELRDPYTMGHQRRVAHLAGALAREMGLDERQEQEIHRAGLVHDIGKIKVPSEFLSKPGKLAEREFAIIREHPSIGSELLKNIELPWPLSDIVLQHHERMDGSGYPQGLKGDEILPAARIIAVADVVEAMASYRPYRPALGIDKALAEVTDNSGRLYDAEVVSACGRLFLEKGYRLPVV